MSCFHITFEGGRKIAHPITSREQYLKLRASSHQQANLRLARAGSNEAKHRLVQINYSLAQPPGTRGAFALKGCQTMGTSVGMDVDFDPTLPNYEQLMAEAPKIILAKKEQLRLLMLEKSANKGYHLVFQRHEQLSQEENLKWASSLLGIAYDRGAKDITRVFFTTGHTQADLLFLDDQLFNNAPCTAAPQATPQPQAIEATPQPQAIETQPAPTFPTTYRGLPYNSIVNQLVMLLGGAPEHGSRNSFIFSLACYMRYLCDDNATWIKHIMPTFGEDPARAHATIDSACQRKQAHLMPDVVRRALKQAETEQTLQNAQADASARYDADDYGDTTNPQSYFYQVQQMPKKLPALIRLLVSKTPDLYKPAVAQAVFPPLATHLCGTRFRYIDNIEHEATLMSILCAPTGSGKECVTQPINHIMADIRHRDAEQRARERLWKDECNRKGANKDKRERPEGLVIQEVNIDMTNPAFVLRMKEAEGHFLYAKVNELNLFDALKGRTNQHFRIMELAFDLGQYGQDRVGAQSVTETVQVRFNWNASCTPKKCRDYFKQAVTDGPISRIAFSTIERRPCGSPIPVYGTYDAAFDEALLPYIERLTSARGLITCPEATNLAKQLVNENADFARLSQNYVFENLSFRATVIAWLKACVLYVANGCKWETAIADFARWSLRYDLWCKLRLFGQLIFDADNDATLRPRIAPRGPKNLLTLLPHEFTTADYIRVRQSEGFDTDNAATVRQALTQWVYRGYVVRVTPPTDNNNNNNNSIVYRKV